MELALFSMKFTPHYQTLETINDLIPNLKTLDAALQYENNTHQLYFFGG